MAAVLPFPAANVIALWGLTRDECDAIHAEAFALMDQGRSTGVSHQSDGMYMCVFDCSGEPYVIGREQGLCYLIDPARVPIAESRRFEVVLEALKTAL